MTDEPLDLAAFCMEVAADLDDISTVSEGGTTTFQRDTAAFARASEAQLDVRLPADIAEAALRTPDTATTDERGWIRFTPADAERDVTDRAEAWFRTGWRHAGGK